MSLLMTHDNLSHFQHYYCFYYVTFYDRTMIRTSGSFVNQNCVGILICAEFWDKNRVKNVTLWCLLWVLFWKKVSFVFDTNSQSSGAHRNLKFSCFVSFSLPGPWTCVDTNVFDPVVFITVTNRLLTCCHMVVVLVHPHINSVSHTLWQQTLDSSSILSSDKPLNQTVRKTALT